MDSQLSSNCDHRSCKYLDKVEGKCCAECGGKISVSDGAFACQGCNGCLHKSCAVKEPRRDLSHEITHPLHLRHRLQLEWSGLDFICDKCLYISAGYGYRYRCASCDFSLDFACGSPASGELPKDEEPLRFKDGMKKTIQHYSHTHKLSVFKYRKIHKEDLDCFWCEKHLSGVCHGCPRCKFHLHPGCSDKIPRTRTHPFHPRHPLRLSYLDFHGGHCNACNSYVHSYNTCYKCEKCSFCLDMNCAKLLPTLKLACHFHRLAYFRDTSRLNCRACGLVCGGIYSICRCVQCDVSFHPKCVLPSEAKSKYHRHPLILTEPVKEDDSDEFCCDACEKERDPKHPVYYCQSCTFVAHIQCLLPHDDNEDQITSSMENEEALSEKEMEQNEGTNGIHTLFKPIIHQHEMYEVTEELKGKKYCRACRLELNGPSYFCKKCRGGFYLHEKCTKLPFEIPHPFHSSHPLYLSSLLQIWGSGFITCDECKDICRGFIYLCEQCDFKLDVKCAALTSHKTRVSQEKKMDRVAELQHFSHEHNLVLGYCNDPIERTKCAICELPILGPAYFCPNQNSSYILHESCLRLPQKIQVPFHLKHMLVIQKSRKYSDTPCYACPLSIESYNFAYNCEDCQLDLHPICANYLKRPLKCESHLDDLYYFGTDFQLLCANSRPSWETHFSCYKCENICKGEPFYRCLQCSINFHLKCVPIPDIVQSKYHRHPLTLKDSFVEDDSGKYYCDFCEEERNSKDHVYYCKECNGQTIAHIECVIIREVSKLHL
ncbi:uncharacterized protein LOC120218752 [Hibiscus syriacus]|uniref:uncharacterized protein LOC120218752 n=1 Tax=Hibiscus syriacus TaxID=106335 RepID=UPI001921012B|nr:uncharacterized protein LOC120218752 [Hibiscus syriacus]